MSDGQRSQLGYRLGQPFKNWQEESVKSITFIVTEDCQLRCKYCYVVGKNNVNKLDFSIARRTVDYLLAERSLFGEKSVIFDFIGGEPFLEIDRVDQICDYIKIAMYRLDHPWFNSYRFNFTTNGLMYDDERVQRFIQKNKTHLSIGITLDGTKTKHDANRIFPNGSGSYDLIMKNIPLWLHQFPDARTKSTVSRDDLPYIKESVIHLWELGIKTIDINLVFEDVWHDGDDVLFETQLRELADYIIDHQLYEDHNVSFFSELIGKPLDAVHDNQNWCGAGRMLAVNHTGNFYPCVRFAPFSLNHKPARVVGDCFTGVDMNKLRPFLVLDRISQSNSECMTCEVASGCAWCPGANYDYADTPTIYQRATFICNMHKARVRANDYFWNKLRAAQSTEA
ncbi:radical SAM peptide maturase, CXXX-repeat target family [Heliobacterium gestii]|uniref:Radical SAM peptide maturase, CXXX-repeat target family n=1 Tax=Heliomicrobium gestii TaxID=2699 RepID=A0A845LFI7_HELGE|nr:radical SAM peptide maturase, CXXX-repeat target family [Heliomicrobium gestii]MBM7866514.1 uncharacterized protein [Heliomicrobium gestii]MZP43205.1 radical SAM peptide maturase, CXXX-repeat target family [Heliomicrobium gestii]